MNAKEYLDQIEKQEKRDRFRKVFDPFTMTFLFLLGCFVLWQITR